MPRHEGFLVVTRQDGIPIAPDHQRRRRKFPEPVESSSSSKVATVAFHTNAGTFRLSWTKASTTASGTACTTIDWMSRARRRRPPRCAAHP